MRELAIVAGAPLTMPSDTSYTVNILLAEDNPGDVFLVRRALDSHGVNCNLHLAKDGEEALELIRRAEEGEFTFDLIMADLNLPRFDGGAIVSLVRSGKKLKSMPVVLLTSSESPHDRVRLLELGASHYFQKPCDLQAYMEVGRIVRSILDEPTPAAV